MLSLLSEVLFQYHYFPYVLQLFLKTVFGETGNLSVLCSCCDPFVLSHSFNLIFFFLLYAVKSDID